MKNDLHKIMSKSITAIVQRQTIGGQLLVVGEGMKPSQTLESPYRQLNGIDVYYAGENVLEFYVPFFVVRELHKWGEYYHPYILGGMPSVGGWNKVYVDTRISGWYLLWVCTKLDEWAFGATEWESSLICWTPKVKNDTIAKAGLRLFWASVLALESVPPNEFYCDSYDSSDWFKSWPCTIKCKQVMAAVRSTLYNTEEEYIHFYENSPFPLKEHIAKRKRIKI